MATVIGTSGAWKDVQSRLKMLELTVSHPTEIHQYLQKTRQSRATHFEKIGQELELEIQTLQQTISQCEQQMQQDIRAFHNTLSLKIKALDENIAQSRIIFNKRSVLLQQEITEQTQELARLTAEEIPSIIQRTVAQLAEEFTTQLLFIDKRIEETILRNTADLTKLDQQLIELHQTHPKNLQQIEDSLTAIEAQYKIDLADIIEKITAAQASLAPELQHVDQKVQTVQHEKVGIFQRIINWFKLLFLNRQKQVILSPVQQLKVLEKNTFVAKNRKIAEILQQRQKINSSYQRGIAEIEQNKSRLLAEKVAALKHFERRRTEMNREKTDKIVAAKQRVQMAQQAKIAALHRQHEDLEAKCEQEIRTFKQQQSDLQLTESQEIRQIQNRCEQQRIRLNELISNKSGIVRERCYHVDYTITSLENILKSHELTGALAELTVIEELSRLPLHYYVLNDVVLTARRFMKFNHKAVQSAQIDHLIVAPSGVFVVEVKHWSQQFVDSGRFFDPYEQVGRANYLCYCTLKEDLHIETKVRSILAYRGHVPPQTENSRYIKVLPLEQLLSYIRWFERQSPILTASQLNYIVREFHPEKSAVTERAMQHFGFS